MCVTIIPDRMPLQNIGYQNSKEPEWYFGDYFCINHCPAENITKHMRHPVLTCQLELHSDQWENIHIWLTLNKCVTAIKAICLLDWQAGRPLGCLLWTMRQTALWNAVDHKLWQVCGRAWMSLPSNNTKFDWLRFCYKSFPRRLIQYKYDILPA